VTPLERRYRLLMLAYPDEYRREREAEIVGTLLDEAVHGQEWPGARQIAALAAGGLQTRARLAAATPRRMLADGLRLGAVMYFVLLCASTIELSLRHTVFGTANGTLGHSELVDLESVVIAIGVVALAGAAYEVVLAAIVGLVAIQAIMFRAPVPFDPLYLIVAGWVLVTGVVAALAWHPWLRPLRRPWPARLGMLALAGIGLGTLGFLAVDAATLRTTPALVRLLAVTQPQLTVPVAVLLVAAVVGLDPRPALAATITVAAEAGARLPTLVAFSSYLRFPPLPYELGTVVSLALAAAALAITVVCAWRRVRI
jgi:hypothetical protein